MSLVATELELFADIDAGDVDATQTHTPATGIFTIRCMEGEAAFDMNCAVQVKWDGTVIWMTKGSSKNNRHYEFTGDGTKKVELILNATDLGSGSVYLGGYVMIEQVS